MKLKELGGIEYESDVVYFCMPNAPGAFICGYWHFTDGPAVIYDDGYREWWVNDKFIKSNYNET